MKYDFLDFLKSSKSLITLDYGDKSKIMIQKVRYNDKLDILYSLSSYNGNLFDLYTPFKYSGIYDKENNKLFDTEYGIRFHILEMDYNNDEYISSDKLYKIIEKDVNEKVKEIINNGRDDVFNIKEVELVDEIEDRDVVYDFMDGKTSRTLEDSYCNYSTNKPQNILDYLSNKEEFLEEEAREFILDNITNILKGLAISEEKRKALKRIEDNREHPYHKIKEITDAIKNNNCVTVNLTINKNGIEQTFKYKADVLLHNYTSSYLSTYNIEKLSDRNLFEENFGKWEDLHYEDIVKITYGKNTIYEDKSKSKEEEVCLS